eukprot:363455-Chlamydomonas_euryale.AAC.13
MLHGEPGAEGRVPGAEESMECRVENPRTMNAYSVAALEFTTKRAPMLLGGCDAQAEKWASHVCDSCDVWSVRGICGPAGCDLRGRMLHDTSAGSCVRRLNVGSLQDHLGVQLCLLSGAWQTFV